MAACVHNVVRRTKQKLIPACSFTTQFANLDRGMSDLNKMDSEGTLNDAVASTAVPGVDSDGTGVKLQLFHEKQDQPLPLTPVEMQQRSKPKHKLLRVHTAQTAVPLKKPVLATTGAGVQADATEEAAPRKKEDDPSDKEYREIAKKLFNEEFVSIQPEEYTQFLAANDEELLKIRNHYMDLFRWNANLLTLTRTLCSKLYLKGESQEIDRILLSFTKLYIKQHQTNVFCTRNFEKIYIIIYLLILLNTALHNLELNKKLKISQADYIKNTFTTFIQQNPKLLKNLSIKQRIIIERELSNYYESLLKDELHLKQQGMAPAPTAAPKQQPRSVSNGSAAQLATLLTTAVPLGGAPQHPTEGPEISRQPLGLLIWSTDTADNRRALLVMKRMLLATLLVSQYTAGAHLTTGAGNRSLRVGFGRALALGAVALRTNSNNTTLGRVLQMLLMSNLRLRRMGDVMAPAHHHLLHKRLLRLLVVSKDLLHSYADDLLSVLSFDTVNMTRLQLDDSEAGGANDTYQGLEDFDVNDYQDQYDLTLELQGLPYLKEGLLKLKILNNDSGTNADHDLLILSNTGPSMAAPPQRLGFFSFFSRLAANPAATARSQGQAPPLVINKFTENFVVVTKGELSLYSFDPKVIKKHKKLQPKKEVDDDDVVGDGNWLKNAANIGNYNLCLTIAQMEKPVTVSGTNKKLILWSLTFPRVLKRPAKKFIFEAGTREIALEFVNTCNFWAAKITAIPTLEELVLLIEYGWTNLDGLIANRDQFKKLKYISKWETIPRGVYLSNYMVAADGSNAMEQGTHAGMMKQFVRTYKYYNHLRKLYNDFIGLQNKFLNNFPQKLYGGNNYSRIVQNYDQKISEYKSELSKYKNYLIILGFGLQLRFDMEDEDKEERKQGIKDGLDVELIEPNLDDDPENDEDDDLTQLVKMEIRKLFLNMKDVSKYIPTFQTLKLIGDLAVLTTAKPTDNDYNLMPPIKTPTLYTLSQYRDNELPINQLMHQTADAPYPTATIKEEDEPEETLGDTTPTNLLETLKKLQLEVNNVHVVAL